EEKRKSRMFNLKNFIAKRRSNGQALVETALFLPIFLVILAGVVEVSQFVVTTNRLTSAARAGTRFASNGGEDAGVLSAFRNSITNTMNVDENIWDVFTIRATLNGDGTGFSDWEFNHIYGISNTQTLTPINQLDVAALQTRILDDLQFDEDGNRITNVNTELADLRIVGTYIIHDMESLLNLDATPALSSIYSVNSLNVMRISGLNVVSSDGCAAFPLALGLGARSISGDTTGGDPFPTDFQYPLVAPNYFQFVRHQPNISLDNGTPEGTIFRYFLGTSNANFQYLKWNQQITSPADETLANSVRWPGDSLDYSDHADPGIPLAEYGYVVRGYAEPGNTLDTELHIEDFVAPSTAQLANDITFGMVNDPLNESIALGRDLRLIVFNSLEGGSGNIIIARFGVFKIRGYGGAGTANEWILVEFTRWDDTCGQNIDLP
ncbi:MAG: TadE/TadG family type IV pilus assembly protein, partial [Chloroflexota bacterium]